MRLVVVVVGNFKTPTYNFGTVQFLIFKSKNIFFVVINKVQFRFDPVLKNYLYIEP